MPQTILKQCCVRTHLKINGENVNQGSGVIVQNNNEFYVLTAEHCIHGPNLEYKEITPENIIIEYQNDYTSPFVKLKILSIVEIDHNHDWALIEIEKPNIICDFLKVYRGDKFIEEEKIVFRGYQNVNVGEPRNFQAKVIELASNEFKITLTDESFEQGGELGSISAKGLSGSGVYIIRANRLYLIGHVKSVLGEAALNDDIKCCRLRNLDKLINSHWVDLDDPSELKLWERANEDKLTDEDVEKWVACNDLYFNNILRKCNVLYPEEKARRVSRERTLAFLEREYQNNEITSKSDLITQYNATSEVFEKSVKEDYSRNVADSNEAKDLLIKLESEFSEHIKDLIGDKTNIMNLNLARHKVTWWLMNCSFDFKD
ncbi:MAG: trypsin-like serine protease [Flavobacterium sp.]|nr:MAG: trypsin-like serine protease [Flavobacterium sp.]